MLKITKRKGWRSWLFTVIALCFASNMAAQVTVEIGTGTTTVGYPYYTLYEDARTQMIYDASEIIAAGGEAGDIVSIAFNVSSQGSPAMSGFSIDMQNYSGSTLAAFENTGWTNTYSGSYTVAGTGWQTVTLTTPFAWDGTSNLLMNICWDNASWSGNSYVYATASTNKVWHQHTDGAAGCSLAAGSTQTSSPNIRMVINTAPPPPPPPPPLSVQVGTGTATSQYPYYTYWMDSRTQYLYTASEILAAGGLPGDITAIGFNVSSSDPWVMNGFNVDMKNYAGSSITAFESTGWTNVFSGTYSVPGTGVQTITLTTPFEWDGISNILVGVCFNNAAYGDYSSLVYGTTLPGLVVHSHTDLPSGNGCTDLTTPSSGYDDRANIYLTIEPTGILPTGIVQGFVTNGFGVPVPDATVAAQGDNGTYVTTSGPNGAYVIDPINIGTYTMAAVKDGYNMATVDGVLISDGATTYQNFALPRPAMAVTPNPYSVTVNPNELYQGALNINNNGDGTLTWTAEVVYPEPVLVPGIDPNIPLVEFSSLPAGEISTIGAGNGQALSSREGMNCPEGSKFSNVPVGSNNGYTSTTGAGYKCYQEFAGVDGSFTTLTFWAIFTSAPPATMNFNIEICNPGATPGSVITSLNVDAAPVNTNVPVIGYATYYFTVELPSTEMATGWISVQATTASPTFYWLNTMSGIGNAYQNAVLLPEKLAMCLSGAGANTGWLTMGEYEGIVNPYTNFDAPVFFNAEGTEAGEVYTADIVFTSDPDVGTVTVPVTMVVAGPALDMPGDLTAVLANAVTGQVNLSWTYAPTDDFINFIVRRDGVSLGTTAAHTFMDMLPDYGIYHYTVQAVFDEGYSVPAGPVELEWPNPTIFVDPTYIYDELWVNSQATQTVTINNTGEGTLAFSFPDWVTRQLVSSPGFTPNVRSTIKRVEVAKGEVDPTDGMGNRNLRGAGGPDGFGYLWIDSDESGGPAYVWNDISGTGTLLTGLTDDSYVGPVNLGIDFPFYANTYNQVYVSSNGFLSFGSGNSSLSNQNIPETTTPNDLIAWFWDDLNPSVSGTVHYQTVGNEFVIQFTNYNEYGGSGQITAQVRLKQDGSIRIFYNNITGGLDISSATVGIENADGTIATNINYNSAYVANSKAVWIGLTSPGFITSVVPAEGTVPTGGSRDVTITWDATGFDPGNTYQEELVVESNDPLNPSVTILNEMYVYVPAQFAGTVTNALNGEPLNGVLVTANPSGYFTNLAFDDGTAESGWGINAGYDAYLGNYFPVSISGTINSIDLHFIPPYGADMTTPLTVEFFDINHVHIGSSSSFLVTAPDWYNVAVPGVEFNGPFYAMVHWNITGSIRYMSWDTNGPNATAGLGYIMEADVWSNTDLGAGVFILRANVFVGGSMANMVLDPTTEIIPSLDMNQLRPSLSLVTGSANTGRANHMNADNGRDLASFQTMTNEEGEYTLYVDAGIYNVSFEKTGFQTYVEHDTAAMAGIVTPLDAELWEESYPPSFVYAEVNADDTECVVTWGDGSGPYEIVYDDGSAENFAAWAIPGNMNAVKFTPAAYPATVIGGRIYVGDGSFPNNNTGFLGSTFGAMVKAADGTNGLPGTTLDSISVTVNNYGWVSFTGLDVEITEGSFYLVMVQGALSPNCAPIGIDENIPTLYRSYSRNVGTGGNWGLSPFQDMMMRAIVFGSPSGPTDAIASSGDAHLVLKQRGIISANSPLAMGGVEGKAEYRAAADFEDGTRAVTSYRVVRYSNFDPNGDPSTGTKVGLGNAVSGNTYTDGGATWAGLPNGWYAYGVAANYPNNFVSDTIISNIVGHGILAEVTVNVSLTTGGSPAGAVVMLTGQDYPYEMYMETVPESGQVIFPEVWYGHYVVDAMKVGFDDYSVTVNITGDRTINIMLAEKKYKPRNLYVDALTLVATWDEPLAIAVGEDFEGATFPPAGWQALTQNTTGWYATTNGSSSGFTIPSHSKYAVTNDDFDNGDGCCDYLITPEMDWTNLPSYRLNFASFFTGAYSQSAYVEISTDAGATWTVISTLSTATTWVDLEIDLAQYSGVNGLASVWLAFHADDNGVWASGWAVDDVQILSGGVPFNGYGVFLDGTLVDNTPEETYTYQDLNYGQEYLAGVAALFSSGYSELDTYRFRSLFLYPPDSLKGESPYMTDYAHLWWEAPGGGGGGTGGSFMEDFEAGVLSEGWETIQTNGNTSATPCYWTVNDYSSADFVPFGVYHAGLWWDYSHQDEWLITPEVACGAASTLTFESTVWEGSTYLDHYYVKVSTDGGTNWDVVWDASTLTGNGWNYYDYPYSIDLSAYAGEDIKIAFQAIDGDGAGLWYIWFVDNIAFGATDGVTMFPASSLTKISNSTNRGNSSDRIARDGSTARSANAQMLANRTVMGLIGYNLYRDGDLIAYVEHPTTEYFDLNLDPGTYSYHVTAVYDLTPYGFAGQTGESMIEGPVEVTVTYGYDLPFTEDWNTGLFETNQWTADGANWRIAGQTGNPAPSAEFTYNPVQTDYALSLTSSWINGIGPDGYIDGKFYLDFDLKLDDMNATGDETLQVEVFNGSAWSTVATYTAEGDIAWEMKHVDITGQAKNKVFRVRFNAKGVNTLDIFNWQIDNIHIYRVCAPPTNLTAAINFPAVDEVLLNWEAPEGGGGGPSAWLGWDNGTNNDAIGLTGGGTFSVAARFTPAQLGEYAGTSLTRIRFFPYAAGTFVLKVWTGANASQLVLTQPLASVVVGEWNEVALTTPVPVTGATELWFGYTVTHAANDFPAGVDAGPAVAGFGDMISLDGSVWESMATAYALNFNWNLNGYVESVDGVVALQPIHDNTVYGPVSRLALGNLPMSPHATVTNTTSGSGRELVGYNVWRDGTLLGNTAETTYLDETVVISNYYCYVVTAVYEDCESEPSNEACILADNVPVVGSNAVSVYPNPSNNVVNIELTNDISQLVVYNFVGQVVYEQVITKDKTIQLNVRNYEAGAYLIKFITSSGESFTKKVAVTH